MSSRILEIATAPRGVPELCQHSNYELLKFAESIGMLPDEQVHAAFQRLPRTERAEQVVAALKAYDAKNGGAPAQAAPTTPEPAAPQSPAQAAAPTQPTTTPAVSGRKPRNSAASQTPATGSTPPAQQVDPQALGMIAALRDDLQVVKANVEGMGKNMLDLLRYGEQQTTVNQKLDAIVWMLGQIGESVIGGAEAPQFIDDAFKSSGKA
jgi:hypothetical protein